MGTRGSHPLEYGGQKEPVPPTSDGCGLGSWQLASLGRASAPKWPKNSLLVGPPKLSTAVCHGDQARSAQIISRGKQLATPLPKGEQPIMGATKTYGIFVQQVQQASKPLTVEAERNRLCSKNSKLLPAYSYYSRCYWIGIKWQ